jgi:hypothetical protein
MQYRLFGTTYILVIVLLLAGSGKSYYAMGIYPILFVFGAYFFEKYIRKYSIYVFGLLVVLMFIPLYLYRSDSMSLTTFEKSVNEGAYRWTDGSVRDIPQVLASMTGWKEIGQKVEDIYMSLNQENRNNCDIYCDNYSNAGAVMFYGKDKNIPQPFSLDGSSFALWAPDSLSNDFMIWVDSGVDDINKDSLLSQWFREVELKTSIDNKYFRDDGTKIYLCESPTENFKNIYKTAIKEFKNKYR